MLTVSLSILTIQYFAVIGMEVLSTSSMYFFHNFYHEQWITFSIILRSLISCNVMPLALIMNVISNSNQENYGTHNRMNVNSYIANISSMKKVL